MAQETYLIPEQAAKAFVEGPITCGTCNCSTWTRKISGPRAEVTGVNDDGTWTHRAFLQHARTGWTGGAAVVPRMSCGGGWVRAPERGEAGYDGRNGVSAFSVIVSPDVQEVRVTFRTRRLSIRRRVRCVPADGGRAFVAVWRCHSSWVSRPLPGLFAQVRVDPEARTVVWSNGADLAPEALYFMVARRRAG